MRLGFDAIRAFRNATGLGAHNRTVIRLLAEAGRHDLLLYTPTTVSRADPSFPGDVARVRVRTRPAWLRGPGTRQVWRTWLLGRQVAGDQVTVYHGLSHELPRDLPGRGVRTVVTVHDLLAVRFPDLFGRTTSAIYDWKYRWSCQAADLLIAVSEQTRRDLATYYEIPSERVRVIPPGIDPRFRQPATAAARAAARARYDLPATAAYVISVGTVEPRKNGMLLLRALARLAPAERPLVLFAGRLTAYARSLRRYLRDRSLAPWVRLAGPVAADDLPALVQDAALAVVPSRFEGFGMPVAEALVSGTPVVAAAGSSLEEAGGPGSRYVDPDDPDALAEAMATVLGDGHLAERMRAEGRVWARRFDDAVLREQLEQVHAELAG